MDVLTTLDSNADYSTIALQLILGAWVLSTPLERKQAISTKTGYVSEDDYDKRSVYSLYRSMGVVRTAAGEPYELTFNTWGYSWPKGWGESPTSSTDPQRFGKNAYTGLLAFDRLKGYVEEHDGRVHVVEMGCGTGAGADHICHNVLPKCTYEAVDMQRAAIETCKRKFVPALRGRLVATHADVTQLDIAESVADIVAICETHVTHMAAQVTKEDAAFFDMVARALKPGGFLVWGNAIPDSTWKPCFDYLASVGVKLVEARDVTPEAIVARDEDEVRVKAYVEQCLQKFYGFRIPFFGRRKREEARIAMENFYRNPGTDLYGNMAKGQDTYKVVLFQKAA
jgi:SAM-dependent methyltransferase